MTTREDAGQRAAALIPGPDRAGYDKLHREFADGRIGRTQLAEILAHIPDTHDGSITLGVYFARARRLQQPGAADWRPPSLYDRKAHQLIGDAIVAEFRRRSDQTPGPRAECWNAFCVAADCDRVRHTDAVGYSWDQARGTAYCPGCGAYVNSCDHGDTGVFTDYERYSL
jgi:hypothetical protein